VIHACVRAETWLAALVLILACGPAEAAAPALPRLLELPPTAAAAGRVIAVAPGGNFQAALERAQPGDVITLAAGATYVGAFTLPKKTGDGWITIQSSAVDALPPAGTRVTPEHARHMPKVRGHREGPAITTATGAHHYRFVGIEFHPDGGRYTDTLILIGDGQDTDTATLPHHIAFERCFIHGDPVVGGKRGVGLNGGATIVVDSWLSDWKGRGHDTQALAGWNGLGPFKIVNNYIEGAGENLIFGGADPRIRDLVPSDIEIRRNHFAKPRAWNIHDRARYAGAHWSVKNLFELKNARRVLVDGNLFEHNWNESQSGYAIVITPRNQDGAARWSGVEDLTFTNNVVRRTSAALGLLGWDNNHPSQQLKRVLIRNNLFEEIGGREWGENGGILFLIEDNTADVTIEHNTAIHSGNIIAAGGRPNTGFVFRDNIVMQNEYGVIGDGRGPGLPTLQQFFPGVVFEKNVIVGGMPDIYPRGNFFPASLDRVGFANRKAGDCRLLSSSPYRGRGTQGRDPGVDFAAVLQAIGPQLAAARARGEAS
jgi:hypothetical protein